MGRKRLDLVGQRFGRLTVISLNEEASKQKKGTNSYWNCKCDCGNETIVRGSCLRSGATTSCGCYQKEKTREIWKDEEFRQKQSNGTKEKWKDEEYRQMQIDRMSGENSPHWKGGITPISIYLRSLSVVIQWRKDTYIRENNRCQLTGKKVHGGNSDVHHLYGFNMIVLEAHELHNIQIHDTIGEYTQEELHKLEEYVASWHKDTSNAVLLSKEVHELFHNYKDEDGNVLYGYGNNTPEQFEEFKQRYMAGEFEGLI